MKNKKKLILALVTIGAILLLSGCAVPTDPETKQTILITSETTFKSIMASEDWFATFFVFPMAKFINWAAPFMGVAGAIAALTFGVHTIVLLASLKSTIASQKMQTLQPELARIQKKYEGKDDQQSKMKMAQEQQAVYSENGINPFGAMITQFIQLPIIFAIYHAVQRAEVVLQGSFLGMGMSITPWNGIKSGNFMYAVMFIVMIVAQLGSMMIPQWINNYKAKKEAEKQHRKYVKTEMPGGNTMYIAMLPVLLFSISWASAMTIYWIISSIVNILKTLLIQFVILKDK